MHLFIFSRGFARNLETYKMLTRLKAPHLIEEAKVQFFVYN